MHTSILIIGCFRSLSIARREIFGKTPQTRDERVCPRSSPGIWSAVADLNGLSELEERQRGAVGPLIQVEIHGAPKAAPLM